MNLLKFLLTAPKFCLNCFTKSAFAFKPLSNHLLFNTLSQSNLLPTEINEINLPENKAQSQINIQPLNGLRMAASSLLHCPEWCNYCIQPQLMFN